jgi:hypothetical protein
MTAARRQRKRALARFGAALALVFAVFGGAYAAATTERIVVDPQTGLAISGFDPVAYFTEASAKAGEPDIEKRVVGVVWRFRNEGNRDAFVKDPDVYMPRFGGYDPVTLARGTAVPGHPSVWMIVSERLYLFYDDSSRAAFAADPGRAIATAERKWPELQYKLSP